MANSNPNDDDGMALAADTTPEDQKLWKGFIAAVKNNNVSTIDLGNRLADLKSEQHLDVGVCFVPGFRGSPQAISIRKVIDLLLDRLEETNKKALEAFIDVHMDRAHAAYDAAQGKEPRKSEADKVSEDLMASLGGKLTFSDEQTDQAAASASGSGSKKRAENVDDGVEQESLRMKTLGEKLQRVIDQNTDLENQLSEAKLDVQELDKQLKLSRDEGKNARSQLELYEQEISNLQDKLGKAESARDDSAPTAQAPAEDNGALAQAQAKLQQALELGARLEQEAIVAVDQRDQEIQRLQANGASDDVLALIAKYEGDINDRDAKIAALWAEGRGLIDKYEAEFRSKVAAIAAEGTAAIRDKDATIAVRDAAIAAKDAAIDQLKATVAEKNATIEQQHASASQVEADKAQGEAAAEQMQSTISSLQSEQLAMQTSADEQSRQLEASRAENEALQREAGAASSENAGLRGANAELQQKLARLNEKRVSDEARFARELAEQAAKPSESSSDVEKALLDAMDETIQAKRELNRALDSSRELKRAHSRVERLEEARKNDASTIEGLRKENDDLAKRAQSAHDLRRKYLSGQDELKSARDIIKSLQQRVEGLEAAPARQMVNEMTIEAHRDQATIERLRAKVAEQDSEAAQGRKEMRRLLEKAQLAGPRDAGGEPLKDKADARLSEEASALRKELGTVKKEAALDKETIAYQTVCIGKLQEEVDDLRGEKVPAGERRPLAMLANIRALVAGMKPRPAWKPRSAWAA